MQPKPRLAALVTCLVCLLAARVHAQSDPFVGRFSGEIDGISHELLIFSDSPGNYDGELLAEGKRVALLGRRFGDYMTGKIGLPDDNFAFRARILGAVLLIERENAPPLRFFRKTE